MRFPAIVIIILFTVLPFVRGQNSNEPDTLKDRLSLNIESMNFFRNNEYFNPIGSSDFVLASELPWYADKSLWVEGYTLTGFFFRPELVYNLTSNITLRAGGHFLNYWGAGRFTRIRPVFSTSVDLTKNTILTLGSLRGSDKHRFFDPHFDKERLYREYDENGLEIVTNTGNFFNDLWINWENFIFRGDTDREIFTVGESFRHVSPLIANTISIELPLQIQFKHFGGQISNYSEHVTTFFNAATGLRVNFDVSEKRAGQVSAEYTWFYNKVIPGRETYILNEGSASWWRLQYNYKSFSFTGAYWHADDFYAPNGNPLYASVFVFESDYIIQERKLLTAAASINLLPQSNLELFFSLETYYDIPGERLDHAATLHLNFEKLFRLPL